MINQVVGNLSYFCCFCVGMMLGGYMWGCLADQRGRRRVLVVSLTVNGLFGALASLALWFWLFLLLRFISGVGLVHGFHIYHLSCILTPVDPKKTLACVYLSSQGFIHVHVYVEEILSC